MLSALVPLHLRPDLPLLSIAVAHLIERLAHPVAYSANLIRMLLVTRPASAHRVEGTLDGRQVANCCSLCMHHCRCTDEEQRRQISCQKWWHRGHLESVEYEPQSRTFT